MKINEVYIFLITETQLSSPETFDLEREVSPGSRESLDEVRIILAEKEVNILSNFSRCFLSIGSPLSDVTLTLTGLDDGVVAFGHLHQRGILTVKFSIVSKNNSVL